VLSAEAKKSALAEWAHQLEHPNPSPGSVVDMLMPGPLAVYGPVPEGTEEAALGLVRPISASLFQGIHSVLE